MSTAAPTPTARQLVQRALEHRPGGKDHPQENHGRWSAANRARTAARELEELRQAITGARQRADERTQPVITAGEGSKAAPTRMRKDQYISVLAGEYARLLELDGKEGREAKAQAREVVRSGGSIDDLKERNKALRRKLKAQGVDYRTDEQRREDDAEKNALLDEVETLAAAGGYDGPAKRAGAAKMTTPELRKFVQDFKEYQARQNAKQAARRNGPAAEEAWKAAEDNSRASSRQVGYIIGLLKKQGRYGDTSGSLQGPTTKDAIQQMSKGEAGAYINSLVGGKY